MSKKKAQAARKSSAEIEEDEIAVAMYHLLWKGPFPADTPMPGQWTNHALTVGELRGVFADRFPLMMADLRTKNSKRRVAA